ncbi:MAG: HTH domain protein [Syntrophaceae bacterium PtaB.Bin038]|nr:MAG: HTH domain protein [Syntrophaceae bacterium PtaB.Bin038]
MTGQKNTHRRLMRVGQMLKLFLEKERVTTATLSREFHTTARTIQRDLAFLKQCGFPVTEAGPGVYKLDKDIFKNFELFDENELALIVALKCAVSQLGQPFRKAADEVFNRLYQASASQPVYIHVDESVPLDARLMNRLLKAIRLRRRLSFHYASAKNTHPATVDPYRIVHYDGFWYLVAKEDGTGIVKRYALDKLKELKMLNESFPAVPANLDELLRQSANIWFTEERNLEVLIEVNPKAAGYFKRRKIFPTQEIRETKPDGSLIVSLKVGNFGEIRETLKMWLPNVRILEPEGLRKDFITEVQKWLSWQNI